MSDEEFQEFLGEARSEQDQKEQGMRLLDEARAWWDNRHAFRTERRQARDYFRSRQWEEQMNDPDNPGSNIKEKDYIERSGRLPLVMNLTATVINNISGQFRQNKSERLAFAVEAKDEEAVMAMNEARRAVRRFNESHIIEADQFLEHILSGSSGFKSSWQWSERLGRHEVVDHEIDQTRFFFNTDIADRRFKGLRIIGELHDLPLSEIVQMFARSRREAERLIGLYGQNPRTWGTTSTYGHTGVDQVDFMFSPDPNMCRVIEVWKPVYEWVRMGIDPMLGTEFEVIPGGYGEINIPDNQVSRIQNQRRELGLPLLELDEPRYQPRWNYFFLTPTGEIIKRGTTPYRHGEHPYSPGLALLLDGESWGIISNIRDPQRWLNRLLANIDHMMGAGSKGAIAYDEKFLNDTGVTKDEVNEWYTSMRGSMGLNVPQGRTLDDFVKQYQSNALPAGYFELVPLLMQFMEKISGVSEAAQGLSPKSGTSAALYSQQIIQANTNVLAFLQTYFETLRRKDRKELQLILQANTEQRVYTHNGTNDPIVYDPERVSAMDWDVAMGDVADTATYRQLWEGDLKELLTAGLIPLEVYLQASSNPMAEPLLRLLQNHMAMQPALAGALTDPATQAALANVAQ